jgi:hypothetical protein
MKRQYVVLAASIAGSSGGCWDDYHLEDDDETGGTDTDGVSINCLNENYLNSWWHIGPGGVPVQLFGAYPELLPINICIGPANMGADFDLVAAWDQAAEGYPAFDAKIRERCSKLSTPLLPTSTGTRAWGTR